MGRAVSFLIKSQAKQFAFPILLSFSSIVFFFPLCSSKPQVPYYSNYRTAPVPLPLWRFLLKYKWTFKDMQQSNTPGRIKNLCVLF